MKTKSLLLTLILMMGGSVVIAAPARHPSYEPKATKETPRHTQPVEGVTYPRVVEVSAIQRYDRDSLTTIPEPLGEPLVRLFGWRGERVSAQVLIEDPAGLKNVFIPPCVLTDATTGKAYPLEVNWVRYTRANGVLVGDILDPVTGPMSFEGVTRPIYLTFDIPREAMPETGKYEGDLKLFVNGQSRSIHLEVAVVNQVLPPPSEWGYHLDLWQHPDAVARWHDVPMWSREHLDFLKPLMQRLAAMGQKTITATLIDEAWNAQTYDWFRSMVKVTKRTDGSWAYDYSAFDTWVTFMRDEIGMKDAYIHCYTMVPWSLKFAYFDEATGQMMYPQWHTSSAEYEAFWGSFLTHFVEHLREKGWESRTRLALDERPDNLLLPALKIAQKYAPSLKIVAACDRPSQVNSAFDDVSYAYSISEQLVPLAEKRRAEGKLTTFYVCVYPNRPNTFMASDLAESEWLPLMSANYGLDGMLRWAYHSWVENPLVEQDFTSWPSGDTSLVYPGNRSSLRLEALRNGIESVEKIRIFREKASPEAKAALEGALKQFTVPRGAQAGIHEGDVRVIHAILNTVPAEE
ncbi:MAG: DUF4091 domain-containing protein [bacterium]|nr:DUF4091 domain-containing protein [bacterium]